MGSPTKRTWTIRERRDAKYLKKKQKKMRIAQTKARAAKVAKAAK